MQQQTQPLTALELSQEQQRLIDERPFPFTVYKKNLATVPIYSSLHWLWEKRLSIAGITLLDGDHGTGKTLLALQIAAHVSSGTPMPDGSQTIQSGVVIVTPHTDATASQLQLLEAMGADLSRHVRYNVYSATS